MTVKERLLPLLFPMRLVYSHIEDSPPVFFPVACFSCGLTTEIAGQRVTGSSKHGSSAEDLAAFSIKPLCRSCFIGKEGAAAPTT